MSNSSPLLIISVFIASITLYFYRRHVTRRILPFPPGPKPLPLVGNILDLPGSREYETYTQLGKEYGDVVHLSALGKHIIILNSIEAANDLLHQRSAIYSDRPIVPMLHEPELMDSAWIFAFKPYSSAWRRQRRLFSQHLNSTASREFLGRQVASTHALLRSLLVAPEQLEAHLKHTAANIILGIAYGYDVESTNDPLVELADRMIATVSQGVNTGGYLVNVFPWLNYIPAWFPGTKFKAFASETRKLGEDVVQIPYKNLETLMAQGIAPPSFVTNALVRDPESHRGFQKDIPEVAAAMYLGGSDTTVSSLHFCILAVILNPSVQSRAQAECDAVLGPANSTTFRLPTFEDRPNLPYIDAILKECLRWIPVVPCGFPHSTTEEDEYRGWRIPKGSIVIANAWAILRDERIYSEPFAFRPERFLSSEGKPKEPDPEVTGAFGFGRRACPGRHLAEATLWIAIASLLAVFNFAQAKDADGHEIDISYATAPSPAFFLHPQPFPCSIKPRSSEVVARLRETALDSVF